MTGQEKILLVDDEVSNLQLLRELLENYYDVYFAKTGIEALERVQREDFECILLDIMMPQMDGFSVLKQLQATPQSRDIPVILQTALNDVDQIAHGYKLGAFYYITKPIDIKQVLPLVSTAIARGQRQSNVTQQLDDLQMLMQRTSHWTVQFRTMEEARCLSYALSLMCDNKKSALVGFSELLCNAVEHGIAGIGYSEKSHILTTGFGAWLTEIQRRIDEPNRRNSYAHCMISRSKDGQQLNVTIQDPGDGFDYKHYLDFDPNRATHSHGRGVALAKKTAFPSLRYSGTGNCVHISVATKNTDSI